MKQHVLISGGQGELALAVAAVFRAAGHEVTAPGRDRLDVADPVSVADFFRTLEPPDLMVANAGTSADRLLARTSEADWDRVMEVNLHGAARCARAALRSMVRRRGGHLVFISSGAALHPRPGQAAYAAAKAGLIGLGRSLAREAGPAGIRVNVILPGFLETRMTSALSEPERQAVRNEHALGRFNTPAEVAAFLLHLHLHQPHCSGQVFQLDSRVG